MNEDIAISVESVSKTFKLPHERSTSVKDVVLHFYNRNKTFERQRVLDDVSFDIKKGEFFGIVGRNGSGKSTLLKLLAGIYTPSDGNVTVHGRLTPFIELGVGFNPALTGRENVFLNGALLGFSRKEMLAMYDDIVKFAELEKFMDQKLKNYSSGMQVRLAFSIAIRAKSDILLIDEVLAVGDESFQRKCMQYFVKLKRAKQTVVFVTHDMSQVARFCDRAIYIEDGKLLKNGSTSEIAQLYTKKNLDVDTTVTSEDAVDVVRNKQLSFKVDFVNGNRIESQSDLKLRISWQGKPRVRSVGVTILKDTGEYVFATNTRIDNITVKGTEVTYSVTCNLIPSAYTIGVGLFGETDVDLLAYEPRHAEFVVDPNPDATRWDGITNLKHDWS